MEFRQTASKYRNLVRTRLIKAPQELLSKYPVGLQMYVLPPIDEISLEEFTDFALERLKVLRIVERVCVQFVKGSKQYLETLHAELRKEGLESFEKIIGDNDDVSMYENRRKDYISHFILRLAYCKTEDLRRWFIKQETDLFQYRFRCESRENINEFLKTNNLNYVPISESEKNRLSEKLRSISMGKDHFVTDATDFFKVHFTEILDMVAKRKVYLENGFGYVRSNDISSFVSTHFRANLSHALSIASRSLFNVDEDSRLYPLLDHLPVRHVGRGNERGNNVEGQVTPAMLDALSISSFPLCMRQLHEAMRQNHHLRHGGRMQYTLFLKGIGVSLEDALQFWREEFLRIMDGDKFDKQYSYTIRHSYGKEGKRVNYTPFTCMKIIMSNPPSTGDHHGCPFRHSEQGLLRQKLATYNVPPSGINEVIDLVRRSHYQLACSRYFELTHGSSLKSPVNHPNVYFQESFDLANGTVQPKKEATERSAGTKSTMIYSSQMSQSSSAPASQLDVDCEDRMFEDDMDMVMASME